MTREMVMRLLFSYPVLKLTAIALTLVITAVWIRWFSRE